MSSGPLLQLVAQDHGGIFTNFPALANSSSYTVQELTGASHYTVDHHGVDVVEPIAMGITTPHHQGDALIIRIGGSIVTRVPLSLLFLSGHTTPAENIHRFDISPFFPPIEVVRLSYHVVEFSLESGAPFALCLRKTCLPHTKRQHLAQEHERKSIIQQVASHTFGDISSGYTKYIPFTGFTKGYIVEAPDISHLTHFRLQIGTNTNMYDLINYGPALLAVAAHRLSPHHMWIPLYSTQIPASLFSRTDESFVNGLNHSGIDNTAFTLEFTAPQPASSVHIHSILINKFRSCYGMGSLYYENELTP